MVHRKLTASGAEVADEKAASNRGRGGQPRPSPQEGWVFQVESYGEAGGERGGQRGLQHNGIYGILREEGGVCQGEEGVHLYIKFPNPN